MKRFVRASIVMLAGIIISILGLPLENREALAQPCEPWVSKAVSIQGSVQVRRSGGASWVPVRLNDVLCPGDLVRVLENSRAALLLPNDALLRIDQNTAVKFPEPEEDGTSLIDMIRGVAHFFSRMPRSLKVLTPFVNGYVEGTEFLVQVFPDEARFSVFQGRVAASNAFGSLSLTDGQSAMARASTAPVYRVVVKLREAVEWALYYPPIIDYKASDFRGKDPGGWKAMVRRSIIAYSSGDPTTALSGLSGAPSGIADPRFFAYRAGLLLTVGRVAEAESDIATALALDPADSDAVAIQSIIAMVRNQKQKALELARQAVALDPASPTTKVALAYAYQADFKIQKALESSQSAVDLAPGNALAWARLAELWLSTGFLDKALRAAEKAVELNPRLAHTQTILGFAYLSRIDTKKARAAFESAIALDSAAPLSRLGLGLTIIRDGDLIDGRRQIEIAASLDPGNSLIRSYLGKAFYDEKRDTLSAGQLEIAKQLDPNDPTPWFYDALRKQSINRPVEALGDLQKSIELNDNRAVFRSKLLLDDDLAARSASLGRIYGDLGFKQLALIEGWKSLNTDPGNFSAHRFLSDAYTDRPRHEIARVSELLQSQLLQPININPVQPHLAESSLFILEGSGPAGPGFNEFNPLFSRNRLALQASGVAGQNETLGDELTQSGLWGGFSYSLGQFHYETDGFRENNDQSVDILNAFVQGNLTFKDSLQAEYRYKDRKYGDLPLRFELDDFLDDLRQKLRSNSFRLGYRHSFKPGSDLIASIIYQDLDTDTELTDFGVETGDIGIISEVQHLYKSKKWGLVSGLGYVDIDNEETVSVTYEIPPDPPVTVTSKEDSSVRQTNLYLYSQLKFPQSVAWTIGGSFNKLDDNNQKFDLERFNPKLGVIWNPWPTTAIRAAAFRVLKRALISNQTIEPTQVAGFNQFFDDANGTEAWRYGVAADQQLTDDLFFGLEYSKRDLKVPFRDFSVDPFNPTTSIVDWEENTLRSYLYWTPHPWFTATAELLYEEYDRSEEFVGPGSFTDLNTYRVPLGLNFFHPCGAIVRFKATYIDQSGEFGDPFFAPTIKDDDQNWLFDASVGYRLPKRLGLISIEAKNLSDADIRFQDTDPANPHIYPERVIVGKITLAF